ncbi:hypothetical protein IAT38_002727 [Cryptococcus sp. DSM 104549]
MLASSWSTITILTFIISQVFVPQFLLSGADTIPIPPVDCSFYTESNCQSYCDSFPQSTARGASNTGRDLLDFGCLASSPRGSSIGNDTLICFGCLSQSICTATSSPEIIYWSNICDLAWTDSVDSALAALSSGETFSAIPEGFECDKNKTKTMSKRRSTRPGGTSSPLPVVSTSSSSPIFTLPGTPASASTLAATARATATNAATAKAATGTARATSNTRGSGGSAVGATGGVKSTGAVVAHVEQFLIGLVVGAGVVAAVVFGEVLAA